MEQNQPAPEVRQADEQIVSWVQALDAALCRALSVALEPSPATDEQFDEAQS